MTMRKRSSSLGVTSPCRLGSTASAIRTESRSTSWLNDFTVESTIGRGKFAVVKKCVEKSTGRPFAAKCIRKRRANRDCTPDIFHEIAVLEMSANEPYLIDLYRVYETASEVVLILEYAAGGEIFDHCVGVKDTFSEAMSRRLLLQILEGVHFLHDNNIVHLDLKPQNILLTKEGTDPDADIKLVDFGLSKCITNGLEVREILGTPDYVAPEVLNYEPLSTATDIWSLGVVSYVMLTGVSPFLGDSKQETLMNVTTATLEFPADLFGNLSPSCQDLIHKMLQKDPSERMTARDSLSHPWVSGITNPCLPLSIKNTEPGTSSDEEVFASNGSKSTSDSDSESASVDNNNTIDKKEGDSPQHAPVILVSEAKITVDLNGNLSDKFVPDQANAHSDTVADESSAVDASNQSVSEIDINGNIIDDLAERKDCKNEKVASEAKNGSDCEGLNFLGQATLHLTNTGECMPRSDSGITVTGSGCVMNQVPTVFTSCETAATAAPTSNPDAEITVDCFKSTCCVPLCPRSVEFCLTSPTVRPRRESNKENLVSEESATATATVKTLLESEAKDPISSPRITRLTLSSCTNSPNTAPGPLNTLLPQGTDDLHPVGERSTEVAQAQIPAFKAFNLTVHVPPGFTLVNGQSPAFKPQPHKDLTGGPNESDPSLKRRKFDFCKPSDQGTTEIPVVD